MSQDIPHPSFNLTRDVPGHPDPSFTLVGDVPGHPDPSFTPVGDVLGHPSANHASAIAGTGVVGVTASAPGPSNSSSTTPAPPREFARLACASLRSSNGRRVDDVDDDDIDVDVDPALAGCVQLSLDGSRQRAANST